MNLAHALIRRRRQYAFAALTVLLHVLVFDWFNGQLGRQHQKAPPAQPAPLLAQLVRVEVPAPPPPAPLPLPPGNALPPLPALAPEPVALDDGGLAPASAPAPIPATAVDADAASAAQAPAGQESDAVAAAHVQSQAAVATPAAPPAAGAAPAPPSPVPLLEQHRYKIDLPPPADIMLDVERVDAKGTHWRGEALLSWRRTAPGYRIQVEASIGIVFTRVSLLTLTSEGTVGDEGFVPILMTEKRRGRAMTATHFNRKDGTLSFSASQATYALTPGIQDKASLPLQLAAIGRGDPTQLSEKSGTIDIPVGGERDASVYSFTVAGQAQVDTRLGRISTWHLVRPPKPGSYHSRLEVWLAPGHGWLPVQIRNVEANGAVTTQTASNIVIKETGSQ